jgi:hypothetical protein
LLKALHFDPKFYNKIYRSIQSKLMSALGSYIAYLKFRNIVVCNTRWQKGFVVCFFHGEQQMPKVVCLCVQYFFVYTDQIKPQNDL